MVGTQKSKLTTTKITDTVEGRIVEVSLKHPDYGVRRLIPLLEQEEIQVSTTAVYAILKRNELHTKSKRLSNLEAQRSEETPTESAITTPPEAAEQDHIPPHTPETTPKPRISPSIKALKKTTLRPPWALSVPNLLLLGIIGYFWASAIGNFLQARHEPMLPSDSIPLVVESKPEISVRPLEDYNIIVERSLFGSSAAETSAPEEEIALEDVPTVEKSLGLKLVGTVAGDDSAKRFAIIDNKSTRKQELYREGDKAGEVLIKRILRNNVIVDAGRGEELLALELKESGKKSALSPPPQRTEKSRRSSNRRRNLRLDRKEVEASLADIDRLIQQVRLTPYKIGNLKGFKITGIIPNSVFTKMGLRSGDAILAINDVPVGGPEQATAFFKKVREGGDMEIRLTRRRRTMRISLKIE